MEFWFVRVVPAVQRSYYLHLCCDFVLHAGLETWPYMEGSQLLFLDQSSYKRLLKLLRYLHTMHAFTQYSNITRVNQNLCVPTNLKPTVWLQPLDSIFSKLKKKDHKTSACFKPFLIGKASDKYLPTGTSFKHIYVSLTCFIGNETYRECHISCH